MEALRFGASGLPLLVFPTSQGRIYQWEDFGMVSALQSKLEAGFIQLWCVDSGDRRPHFPRGAVHRAYLKSAALQGCIVINDPFWWQADEKFFECTLARKLGVAVPKTVVLPNKDYIPDIDRERSLRNLQFPIDWERLLRYTGLPAVLKPNTGGGWKDVHIIHSLDELIRAYDGTGQKAMIVQEFIDWQDYLRCSCIGRQDVLRLHYNPTPAPWLERYGRPAEGGLGEAAIRHALTLTQALGYDMDNSQVRRAL